MKINLKSIRNLKKYLGQLDARIQFNEIILRYAKTTINATNLPKILKEGSVEIKVDVSFREWPKYFTRFYQE